MSMVVGDHCQQAQELDYIMDNYQYICPPPSVIALLPTHFANHGVHLAEAPTQQFMNPNPAWDMNGQPMRE